MSHFTVAVICNDVNEVDSILAPYNENLEMAPYVKYAKAQLISGEKRQLEEMRDGPYAEFLADPVGYANACNNGAHLHFLQNELPHLPEADDEELYQRAVKGYDIDDIGPDGEVYSTYNPNSKWDWHEIGGRWDGSLLVKKSAVNTGRGSGGAFGSNIPQKSVPDGYKWVDYAPIKSIEWDMMRRIFEKDLMPYDKFCEESIDAKFLKPEYFNRMYPDEETYRERKTAFSTYGIIPYDGSWTAPGEMGWFGISSSEPEDDSQWDISFFDRFIKPANQEHLLVIVDCHI